MNSHYLKRLLHRVSFAIIILLAVTAASPVYAQQKTVKGHLTDAVTGLPVTNAAITVKGGGQGAVSDATGNFSLKADSNDSLVVSSLNYLTQTIYVGNQDFIAVKLMAANNQLDQVIVIGYGTQRKKDVTGAVQTVDMAKLQDIPVSQFTQKLQGQLAGVQINETTGQPGKGMSVRIRGQLSVSA